MDEPWGIRSLYLKRFLFWTGIFVIMQFMGLFSIVCIDFDSLMLNHTTCPEHPVFFSQIQSSNRMTSIITLLCILNFVLAAYIFARILWKGNHSHRLRFPIITLFVIATAIAMSLVAIVIVLAIHQDDLIDLVFFADSYSACFNHEFPTSGITTLQVAFTVSMLMCFASVGMMLYYLKWFADYHAIQNLTRTDMSNILQHIMGTLHHPSLPPTYDESSRFYQDNRITLNQHHAVARYLAESDEEIEMRVDIEDMAAEPIYVNTYEMMYNSNLVFGDDVDSSHLDTTVGKAQNEIENRVEEVVAAIQSTEIKKSDDGNSNESEPTFNVINHSDDQMETDGGNGSAD